MITSVIPSLQINSIIIIIAIIPSCSSSSICHSTITGRISSSCRTDWFIFITLFVNIMTMPLGAFTRSVVGVTGLIDGSHKCRAL